MTSIDLNLRRGRLVLPRRVLCWTLATAMLTGGVPAVAFAASADPAPVSATASQYPPFLIGPGDLLNITVYGEKDLPTAFLVESSGEILFPLAGTIKLAGLTQVQASQALDTALEHYIKAPMVTVLVTESAQYTVSVVGSVVKPGKFPIRGLPTLLDVLAEAGGPAEHADLSGAILIHNDQKTNIRLDQFLLDQSVQAPNTVLYPGDILMVPESHWPTVAEWGIIASILSSATAIVIAVNNRR
jgi:protein involved in polysaccharide export with SLBB domain